MGRPTKVTARITRAGGRYPIDNNSAAILEFESGALGVIDCSWVQRSGPNLLELYGTEGSLVIGMSGGVHFETTRLSDKGCDQYVAHSPDPPPAPMQQWINAILRDEPSTITMADAIGLTELMQAFYRSSDLGRVVNLPLVADA